jgi:hypothetical protein
MKNGQVPLQRSLYRNWKADVLSVGNLNILLKQLLLTVLITDKNFSNSQQHICGRSQTNPLYSMKFIVVTMVMLKGRHGSGLESSRHQQREFPTVGQQSDRSNHLITSDTWPHWRWSHNTGTQNRTIYQSFRPFGCVPIRCHSHFWGPRVSRIALEPTKTRTFCQSVNVCSFYICNVDIKLHCMCLLNLG